MLDMKTMKTASPLQETLRSTQFFESMFVIWYFSLIYYLINHILKTFKNKIGIEIWSFI